MCTNCYLQMPDLSQLDTIRNEINNSAQELINDRPNLSWLLNNRIRIESVDFAGDNWFDRSGNFVRWKKGQAVAAELYKYKIEYRAFTNSVLFALFN